MKKTIVSILLLFLFNLTAMNNRINNIYERFDYMDYMEMKREENKLAKLDSIWQVICFVESTFNELAYVEVEDAAGISQIRPIMVADVNKILGEKRFTLEDRWCKEKSFEMFKIYQDFVNPEYDEVLAARFWNGGRTGDKKRSTDIYVEKYFERKNQLYSDDFLLAEK